MLQIRRAEYEDIPAIMKFMDEHWKPGNVLGRDRNFFEWQFLQDDKLNMFIGIDDETGKIYGMMGAVVYSSSPHPDISGCTWQTIKSGNPMLGLEISDFMWQTLQPRYGCSAGMTQKSIKIYVLKGDTPRSMDHYYRLADRSDFRIAKITKKIIPEVKDTGYSLERIHTVDEMKQIITPGQLAGFVMSKDYSYIEKRYFNHPIYQYDIWKVLDADQKASSVMITRDETARGSVIGKIVDFYGREEDLSQITPALDRLIRERNYEYMDIYSFGVPTELYEKGGLCRCDETSENIIPNYFHPFVQKNISLNLIDPFVPAMRLFRGDGDQDRPC